MQAIQTRYHGPGNVRGSCIIARCDAGRVIVSYDHALNGEENHRAAARALCAKLAWTGDFVSGTLPDGSHAHVFIPRT